MSEQVKFEEEDILIDKASQLSRQTAISGLLLKLGLAKTEGQANNILIGVMVVTFLATIFVISRYLI